MVSTVQYASRSYPQVAETAAYLNPSHFIGVGVQQSNVRSGFDNVLFGFLTGRSNDEPIGYFCKKRQVHHLTNELIGSWQ
jgi:hypothetical protein